MSHGVPFDDCAVRRFLRVWNAAEGLDADTITRHPVYGSEHELKLDLLELGGVEHNRFDFFPVLVGRDDDYRT